MEINKNLSQFSTRNSIDNPQPKVQNSEEKMEIAKETFSSLLTRDARVTEEQLYAAAVTERIEETQGNLAAEEFKIALRLNKAELRKTKGSRSVEEATNLSLNEMVLLDVITNQEKNSISEQAFAMAQLDDNTDSLFDGRGEDKAVVKRSEAIEIAATRLAGMIDSEDNIQDDINGSDDEFDLIDEVNTNQESIKLETNNVTWQPNLENKTAKLSLPEHIREQLNSVKIISADGKELEPNLATQSSEYNFNLSSIEEGPIQIEIKLDSGNKLTYELLDIFNKETIL